MKQQKNKYRKEKKKNCINRYFYTHDELHFMRELLFMREKKGINSLVDRFTFANRDILDATSIIFSTIFHLLYFH